MIFWIIVISLMVMVAFFAALGRHQNKQPTQTTIARMIKNDIDNKPEFGAVTCPNCGATCQIPRTGGKCEFCESFLNAES